MPSLAHACRATLVVLTALLVSSRADGQATGNTYINPRGLVTPTGYTHVVVAADRRTVYIAGQVAFDSSGKVVGGSDFAAQAEQVRKNVPVLREIRSRYLDPKQPPANTLIVASLVRPELLLEVEAVAVLSLPLTPAR
jgi:enamine deaminase RidA (YjgF/YER057c/UK114 family)